MPNRLEINERVEVCRGCRFFEEIEWLGAPTYRCNTPYKGGQFFLRSKFEWFLIPEECERTMEYIVLSQGKEDE